MKAITKYANAEYCKTGKMICQRCGEVIKEGFYLYDEVYDKYDLLGYFAHFHKACYEEHPIWKIREEENKILNDASDLITKFFTKKKKSGIA